MKPEKDPGLDPHVDFISFIGGLFTYLYARIRLVVVLVSVFKELVSVVIGNLKKFVMRYMFWGRGNWYRFVVMAGVMVAVFMLPVSIYREPITSPTYAEEVYYQTVSENDLLIERGSSLTLVPKGRSRMDVVSYQVKGGDTLSTIAEQYGISATTLMWANDLSENDFITPDQVLKIPPGNGVVHVVEEGDNLASIAEKYEAAEQAIADVNWIDPPFVLVVGAELFVPEGTMPPPPAPVVTTGYTGTYINPTQPQPVVQAPSTGRFLGWPVSGGRGMVTQCSSVWHTAIDIADSSAPDLVAAAGGTVIFAGMSDPWGYAWSVQIDHGNGFNTWYAHMSSIYVGSGQYVGPGQAIGRMGATGLATGVHVHFELRTGGGWGSRVNPAPYMGAHVCGY
ncbi:MAG: M23 family metallopeptidase [Patescibacteria group bacterium]|nr:M23 family metallopeptidase [Patescibacteria group bacterium]